MNKSRNILLVSALIVFAFILFFGTRTYIKVAGNNERVLRFGLGTKGWGPLFPARQSSLYAAIVISHVYDSLVGVDNTGGFIPNLAKSWDINEDFTLYTFVIDTERMFSDGTKLTAQLYKDSLLHSLKLEAAISNKSALDVLYALHDYSKYESTGDISGIEVQGDNILKLRFHKPFRKAIDQLSGTRYGAYIIRNGEYLGTGPYKYVIARDGLVELEANPYYPLSVPIHKVVITSGGIDDLYNNGIDVALGTIFTNTDDLNSTLKTEILSSILAAHRIIIVNGMRDKVFANKHLRKAVQYLIYKYCDNNINAEGIFKTTPQFYPDLFPGHVDEETETSIIDEGKQYVDDLRRESQIRPIECVDRAFGELSYCNALTEHGIRINCRNAEYNEVKDIVYKMFNADLVSFGVSYASADPDGIYHFLGRNGAIWSPLSSRGVVEKLIEDGRELTDGKQIDEHYKKVTMAILDEVPAIHIGYQNLFLVYNAKLLIPVSNISAKRKAINVTLFQWR